MLASIPKRLSPRGRPLADPGNEIPKQAPVAMWPIATAPARWPIATAKNPRNQKFQKVLSRDDPRVTAVAENARMSNHAEQVPAPKSVQSQLS